MKYKITFLDNTTMYTESEGNLDTLCEMLHRPDKNFAIVRTTEGQEVIINLDTIKHIKEVK